MKHATVIGILILLALGIWLAWPEAVETSDKMASQSDKKIEGNRPENTHLTPKKGIIYVKGMGGIHYDKVMKQVDLKQWCNDFISQEGMNLRTTIKVDVYLKGRKIVCISKNRDLYKTEDMTAQAISEMEAGQGANLITFNRKEWLSLDDRETLAQVWLEMKSTGWDLERMEAELIPIEIIEYAEKNTTLLGFYIRNSTGKNGIDFGRAHPKYTREETLRRRWRVIAMEKIEGKIKVSENVGGNVTYLEAPLEVIEKWKPFYKEKERRQREERKERTPKRVEKR